MPEYKDVCIYINNELTNEDNHISFSKNDDYFSIYPKQCKILLWNANEIRYEKTVDLSYALVEQFETDCRLNRVQIKTVNSIIKSIAPHLNKSGWIRS